MLNLNKHLFYVLVLSIIFTSPAMAATEAVLSEDIKRIAPPTLHFIDVERYQFPNMDINNPAFYPIKNDPIYKSTYMDYLETLNLNDLAANPNRGEGGPSAFLPILAKYVDTGDQYWADACIKMLDHYLNAMQKKVAAGQWIEDFEWPAVTLPLYRKYLIEGGTIQEQDQWFKNVLLYYCRHLHVWGSEPIEWRGGCHRSIPEGLIKLLAAQWYPDIPEAAHWTQYGNLVFYDFWKIKDVPQNDTGYMMGPLVMLVYNGDQIHPDNRIYQDKGMERLWQRLMLEVTPDGAVNPYGPNGGYNSTANYRISMLERLAAKTGDGRYRFAAQKLMNYMQYQTNTDKAGHYKLAPQHAALAYLFTNDEITPIQPSPQSTHTLRNEAMRIAHTDKELTENFLGHADSRENRGHICCSWVMNKQQWPDKFIFRSGWDPGDFFCLVELHPTSFPANPGGIMGMNRYGAPFTQIVTSKGDSPENRLLIEGLSGDAPIQYHPEKIRIDENWRTGSMPHIQSEVTHFEETQEATYAKIKVKNPDGLPAVYEREFIFVKNRFLATREIVTFNHSFEAQLSTIWNTQNIGPQVGTHWANTFISTPVANNGRVSLNSPPVDLLVWFAPHSNRQLQIIDRTQFDARTSDCPAQLRYSWNGVVQKGEQFVFTQVYYPHTPYRFRTTNNNPGGSAEGYKDPTKATAHANGIHVIKDTVALSILKVEFEPGQVEYIFFNPQENTVSHENIHTKRPYLYLKQDITKPTD